MNRAPAANLGLGSDWPAGPAGVAILAGNGVPEGADPIAAAYAGHQFGHVVPLLGEIVDRDGRRRGNRLNGSGPTSFSRRGGGWATLGPVLREYLVSEAMAALGIPTTRALAPSLPGSTRAILHEVGYDAAAIDDLVERGVVHAVET